MQLYQIRYFLAVCDAGSVSQAARLCNVAQPSISRGIRKLEEELGESLLLRDSQGVEVTQFGTMIRPYFEEMLALEEALKEQAQLRRDDRSAQLTIGVMCTLGTQLIQPVLARILALAGRRKVQIIDGSGLDLLNRMEDGTLDLCLSGYLSLPKNAEAHPLYDERYVVSFAKGHRFEAMPSVPVTELHNEPYVQRLECELRSSLSDMLPTLREPEVDVRFESRHENMVQMMILAGLGCAAHPESMPVIDGIYQRPFAEPEMARKVANPNSLPKPAG
jgi:DNA-binding transcriptional LysR family regulator